MANQIITKINLGGVTYDLRDKSSGYTTMSAVESKGYTTMSAVEGKGYTTMALVEAKGYQTSSQVNSAIDNAIGRAIAGSY